MHRRAEHGIFDLIDLITRRKTEGQVIDFSEIQVHLS